MGCTNYLNINDLKCHKNMEEIDAKLANIGDLHCN